MSTDGPSPAVSLRPLARSDYANGFPAILSQLTDLGEVSQAQFEAQFDALSQTDSSITMVGVDSVNGGRIACAATVLFERKFIHGCGLVAHIEDVVVDNAYRGLNLGKRIVDYLVALARERGAYKVILDCSDRNAAFYERCGFERKSVHMALYFPADARAHAAAVAGAAGETLGPCAKL